MKYTLNVTSIHDGTKLKLSFISEGAKNMWIEKNAHNYVLKSFTVKR